MIIKWSQADKIVIPLTFLGAFVISLIITLLLKNKSEKVKNIPFIVISIIILVLEVIKQCKNLPNYNYWSLPLHFCSTFLVWFPLASFGKGKVKQIGFTLSVTFGWLFIIFFCFNPVAIIGKASSNIFGSFKYFHTYTYHSLAIVFTFLAMMLKMYKPNKKGYLTILVFYTIYSAIAVFFAHALQTNYTNLLENSVDIIQNILVNHGYVVYTIFLYFFGLASLYLIYTVTLLIKLIQKKKNIWE